MYYKEVNGLSIAYQQTGKGPALVLLHGFIIDSQIWRLQIKDFSEDFTVIAWDAPGTGQSSDPPETFTMSDWADCLFYLLKEAGINKAHILGLSWGGILAQEFYSRHSESALSIILVGTYAGWKGSLPKSILDERLAACLRDASLPPGEFVQKYIPGMFGNSPSPEVQEEMVNIMSRFHPEGFKLMAISSAKADTSDLLPEIRVPTLLIWGEKDKRSPISTAYEICDAIPGAKLEIIPGAGHVCNLEEPARFNKIVSEFCKNLK